MIRLTNREREIVTCIARGLPNKEIGHHLGIAEGSVKVYASRIFDNLGMESRYELIVWAISHRFIGWCGAELRTQGGPVKCNLLEGHHGKSHGHYEDAGLLLEWGA